MLYFIDYKRFISSDMLLYAHLKSSGEKELLGEHIERCINYIKKLDEEKNIEVILERFADIMDFKKPDESLRILKEMFCQTIVFHDFGKANPNFQIKTMDNKDFNVESYEGLLDTTHSMFSSILYLDYYLYEIELYKKKLEKDCYNDYYKLLRLVMENAYVISRHHGAFDSMTEYINHLSAPSIGELIEDLNSRGIAGMEGYKDIQTVENETGLRYIKNKEILIKKLNLYKRDKTERSRKQKIAEMFYVRLLYSVLVSCDYYATTEYVNDIEVEEYGNINDIEMFRQEFEKSSVCKSIREYEREQYPAPDEVFDGITEINALRNELFLDVEKEIEKHKDSNIFFMEAPTGSGKSNVAMNVSFKIKDDLKKIFYIYPFNSLVEQNRQTVEKLFNDECLSSQIKVVNSITPMDGSGVKIRGVEANEIDLKTINLPEKTLEYYQRILLDRQFLNYPIVLSTHVSFFNILFGSSRSDIFSFLQLSDSVVVLDEIQSYKNSIWAEIIIFLKECAELMGMKIVIMSATLPNLDVLCTERQDSDVSYILPDSRKYFRHKLFKDRVKLSFELMKGKNEPGHSDIMTQDGTFGLVKEKIELEELCEHVVHNATKDKKILVEFIKKKSAYDFYNMLCECYERGDLLVRVECLTGDDSLAERERILSLIREPKGEKSQGIILVSTQVVEAGVDIDMDIGYKNISLLDSEEQFLGRINRSCRNSGIAYFFMHDEVEAVYKNDEIRSRKNFTISNEDMRETLVNKEFGKYYDSILTALKKDFNEKTNDIGLEEFFNHTVRCLNFKDIEDRMKLISENEWTRSVFVSRKIELPDGDILLGEEVWEKYKGLLENNNMDYAEKQVKLSEVKSKMNNFIYEIKKTPEFVCNDVIGELFYVDDSEQYFENGKINKEKIENNGKYII